MTDEEWGRRVGEAWLAGMRRGLSDGLERVGPMLEKINDEYRLVAHWLAVEAYFERGMPWPWRLRRRILKTIGR